LAQQTRTECNIAEALIDGLLLGFGCLWWGKNQLISASELLLGLGVSQGLFIPDELALSSRLVERLVEEGRIRNKVVIHKYLLRDLEEKLANGDDAGINALISLRAVCDRMGVALEFLGRDDLEGDVRSALRELASSIGGTIVTSDPIMAKVCEAMGIDVLYAAPRGLIEIDKLFADGVMSLHLKEGVNPRVKRGKPGNWYFEEISNVPMSREKLELIIAQLMEQVYAEYGRESFLEVNKRGTTILQLRDYRVVITRPPFSDGLEVTIVKPIVHRSLEDYNLPEVLLNRLVERAEGILIAGPPGMGKSTFAQALAEYYRNLKRVVKTIESPRDLQLPSDVTQYSKSASKEGELYDVLLLSRPDYTVFDEMRGPEDFEIFIDLRLAGIGMVGVIHATTPIDAIQRIANRVEIGVLPSIIDTVIFMDHGEVSKIYVLEMVVKVPMGLKKADLSRPTVLVRNFLTGEVEYELYVFGERTFIVPVERGERPEDSRIGSLVSSVLGRYVRGYDFRVEDGVLKLRIPPEYMKIYVKRCQRKLYRLCRELNVNLQVTSKAE